MFSEWKLNRNNCVYCTVYCSIYCCNTSTICYFHCFELLNNYYRINFIIVVIVVTDNKERQGHDGNGYF